MGDINVERIIAKLRSRAGQGIKESGTPADKPDLTIALEARLNHLQEELLDSCVYLEELLKMCSGVRAVEYSSRGSDMETVRFYLPLIIVILIYSALGYFGWRYNY